MKRCILIFAITIALLSFAPGQSATQQGGQYRSTHVWVKGFDGVAISF